MLSLPISLPLLLATTFLPSLTCSLSSLSPISPIPSHNPSSSYKPPTPRICATDDPDPHLLAIHQDLRARARTRAVGNAVGRAAIIGGNVSRKRAVAANVGAPVVIEAYAHFVTSTGLAGTYSPKVVREMVQSQISILNHAFSPSNTTFLFRQPPTYTISDPWSQDAFSLPMKSSLRQGSYSALNLYFQSNLTAPSPPGGFSGPPPILLGYCTLPVNISTTCAATSGKINTTCAAAPSPRTAYIADGCSILAATLPEAAFGVPGYDRGGTAVHEIGHWMGLLHTFQDETCVRGDPGDWVDDTRQERVSTVGCPVGKVTCAGMGRGGEDGIGDGDGEDPVHNFMDYSSDVCYTGFTEDQNLRMRGIFGLLRRGK